MPTSALLPAQTEVQRLRQVEEEHRQLQKSFKRLGHLSEANTRLEREAQGGARSMAELERRIQTLEETNSRLEREVQTLTEGTAQENRKTQPCEENVEADKDFVSTVELEMFVVNIFLVVIKDEDLKHEITFATNNYCGTYVHVQFFTRVLEHCS